MDTVQNRQPQIDHNTLSHTGGTTMHTQSDVNGTLPNHRMAANQPSVEEAPPAQPAATPTQSSDRHLDSLERKFQLVRDFTIRVAMELATGLYLWGPGGIGKSHTVMRQLDSMKANYKVLNSRVTGWGLFCHLEKYPSHITLIEDAEPMLRNANAIGVLRSALDSQRREGERGRAERWVTWVGDTGASDTRSLLFSGGIIILSNSELPSKQEAEALKTRIPYIRLSATDEELRALMWSVSQQGYSLSGRSMTADECYKVCAFLENEACDLRSPLNMRHLISAFAAYIQWKAGFSGTHWHDIVRAQIREQPPTVFTKPVTITREIKKSEYHKIVREILAQTESPAERLRLWVERTKLGQSAFYARKLEIEAESV